MTAAYVPLFQSLLWILFLLVLAILFRKELVLIRDILLDRLQKGSSIKIGPVEVGEMRQQLNEMEAELAETNKLVSMLFLTTMSGPMFENLEKLATGNFGKFEMIDGLKRELYHLRDIGYVEVAAIRGIPQQAANLSDYVTVTTAGQQFVELRKRYLKEVKK